MLIFGMKAAKNVFMLNLEELMKALIINIKNMTVLLATITFPKPHLNLTDETL